MHLFGELDFKGLKLNGPYEVGFREFRTTEFDNEVSVYYPISKDEHRRHINEPGRNTEWLRNGDKTLLGIAKAAGGYAYGGKGKHISLKSMRPFKFVSTNTLNYGTPAKDIGNKLVPVIYCHGLSSNRGMHSGTVRDFASHGYIVFVLDHRDESCSYVESRDGKNGMYYNNDHQCYVMDYRRSQIEIREREIKALIDEISRESGRALLSRIGFSPSFELDLSKLTISGHSFGGMTAIKVAKDDPRVKLCATLDPWFFTYH